MLEKTSAPNVGPSIDPSTFVGGRKKDAPDAAKAQMVSAAEAKQKEAVDDAAKKESVAAASRKAYFAIDDNKNVVIKVVDGDGNIIEQFPPEQYLAAQKRIELVDKNLYSKKV